MLGALLAGERLAGDDLKAEIAKWGQESGDGSRRSLFVEYVNAATLLNGSQPVIGNDLFERARGVYGKNWASERNTEYNRGVPAARAEAIDKLKEFFDRAASTAR